MEDRATKTKSSGLFKNAKDENGHHQPAVAYMSRSHTSSVRPSAPVAPSRPLYTATVSNNPFAVNPSSATSSPYTSDDDDKKEHRSILAPAQLKVTGPTGGAVKPESTKPSVLKPSLFGVGPASEMTKPLLKPATLKGPESKSESEDKPEKCKDTEAQPVKVTDTARGEGQDSEDGGKTGGSTELSSSGNYFTQFLKNKDSDLSDSTNDLGSNDGGFIFGQNLADRVTNSVSPGNSLSSSDFLFGQNLADRVTTNTEAGDNRSEGESTDQATSKGAEENKKDTNGVSSPNGKTLAESANEYLAKHSQKQEYEQVDVVTGEEGEKHVLQMNCKLFVFDKTTMGWSERGRGVLRVNDKISAVDHFQSRIVMRTVGSLRVILNSKIWSGMSVEKANERSVRLSAMDENNIKVFLIMGSAKDSDQLYGAIDGRIQQLKMAEVDSGSSSPEGEGLEKRQREDSPEESPPRKTMRSSGESRDPQLRRDMKEESNDSSTVDPETEASNESFTSSPAVRSSSSEY